MSLLSFIYVFFQLFRLPKLGAFLSEVPRRLGELLHGIQVRLQLLHRVLFPQDLLQPTLRPRAHRRPALLATKATDHRGRRAPCARASASTASWRRALPACRCTPCGMGVGCFPCARASGSRSRRRAGRERGMERPQLAHKRCFRCPTPPAAAIFFARTFKKLGKVCST